MWSRFINLGPSVSLLKSRVKTNMLGNRVQLTNEYLLDVIQTTRAHLSIGLRRTWTCCYSVFFFSVSLLIAG